MKYSSIIDHEHHVSDRHPRMSAQDRAAQFAPFAALTGYEDIIRETARRTDDRIEIDDTLASRLDGTLSLLAMRQEERPRVTLSVFKKDATKQGGCYVRREGRVRMIDFMTRSLVMEGDEIISLEDVADISIEE